MKLFGFNVSRANKLQPRRVKATPAYPQGMMTRLSEDFPILILSADAATRMNLRELRARSQQLERERGGIGERYFSSVEANVIGSHGILLHMKLKNAEGKFDRDSSKAIEEEWGEFCERGNFDITGEHSEQNFDRVAIRSSARDGDALILIYRGAPNKWKIGFQLLEGQYLDEFHNVQELPNGNQIRMGVELDKWKRKVAFWVLSRHPGDYYEGSFIWDGRRTRIPAYGLEPDAPVHAIHLSRTKRPEETRAVPWITPAMDSIAMLAGYEEAELVAARAQASKHVFYERQAFAADGTPLEWDNQGTGQLTDDIEPGGTTELPIGYKANVYDPSHPNQAFADFTKDFRRKIASALNCAYNSLFNDLEGVSYSSMRSGALDEREYWKMTQQWYVDTSKALQFSAWLEVQLLLGTFKIDGRKRVSDFDEVRRAATWKPRRWPWVDPQKDLGAAKLALELKIGTRSKLIADHSSEDFEDVIDEFAEELEYMEEKGMDGNVTDGSAPANNPDDEPTDDPQDLNQRRSVKAKEQPRSAGGQFVKGDKSQPDMTADELKSVMTEILSKQAPAPDIHMHIPEIKIPAPIMNIPEIKMPEIKIPEQKPPVVHVAAPIINIPEQKAPVVNVPPAEVRIENQINLPATRKITVARDGDGKMTGIEVEKL